MLRYGIYFKRNLFKFVIFGVLFLVILKFTLFNDGASESQKDTKSNVAHLSAPRKSKVVQEKLIGVQIISRHGARTPLFFIPTIEQATYTEDMVKPYVHAKMKVVDAAKSHMTSNLSYFDNRNFETKLKGGVASGQLTTVGEKQLYDLGKSFRKKYIEKLKFLKPTYDPSEVYIRSTHFIRTIKSAKALVAGLYTTPEDSQSEFLIHVHTNEFEWLFPNPLSCRLFEELQWKRPEIVEHDEKYKFLKAEVAELNKVLNITATKYDDMLSYTHFYDDLVARKTHGMPVPEHLKPYFEKAPPIAGMELASVHEYNLQVSIGLFINILMNNFFKFIRHNEGLEQTHKFIYYSAHDSTIASVLAALNRGNAEPADPVWPPFGSTIVIELWQLESDGHNLNDASYYFRVYHNGEEMVFDVCEEYLINNNRVCKFFDFMYVLKKTKADEYTHKKECNQTFEESVKKYNKW